MSSQSPPCNSNGILVAGLLLATFAGCKEAPPSPVSPEFAASRAEFAAIAQAPLLKSISISLDQIVKALGIDVPFVARGTETTLGRPTLVGFNRRALIEATVTGPPENLWSAAITVQMDTGALSMDQESHRLVAAFLSGIDKDAWSWISEHLREGARKNFEVRRVDRDFGIRHFTLRMMPSDNGGLTMFAVLIHPSTNAKGGPLPQLNANSR